MMRPTPPESEAELLQRCARLAGLTLAELAGSVDLPIPANLNHHKGWVGQFLEYLLGADAGSSAEPDFRSIGVELKTLPVDGSGVPRETTYVSTVPLTGSSGERWQECWLRRKLSRVLWVPIESLAATPLAERRVGEGLIWSPDEEQEGLLRRDWEELMEMVELGEIDRLSAELGEVLQIRPKAANASVRARAYGRDGEPIVTNPRGFYLRRHFTQAILGRFSAGSAVGPGGR